MKIPHSEHWLSSRNISTVDRAFALQIAGLDSIPGNTYVVHHLPQVIPECRTWSKPPTKIKSNKVLV